MAAKGQCGDRAKEDMSKKIFVPTERDMLRCKNYILQETVGEGTYSKVKKATSLTLKREVAIKIICRDEAPSVFRQRFLPREIEILSFVQHPHIVKVHEIFETKTPPRVYIVTEYSHGGDLLEYVKEHGAVPVKEARYIFYDICRAVGYLHENAIAHRDIKCENILLDRRRSGLKFYAKLCDFGFARRFPTVKSKFGVEKIDCMTNTFCGSAAYASPEILERKAHNPMLADVWALGIVFFVTVFGSMPFDDRDIKTMIANQKRDEIMNNRSKKVCQPAQNLIYQALRPDPQERPPIFALLHHSWFRGPHNSNDGSHQSLSSASTKNKS